MPNTLPNVYSKLEISYSLLRKLFGVREESTSNKVHKIKKGEILMLNVRSNCTGGTITEVNEVWNLRICLIRLEDL